MIWFTATLPELQFMKQQQNCLQNRIIWFTLSCTVWTDLIINNRIRKLFVIYYIKKLFCIAMQRHNFIQKNGTDPLRIPVYSAVLCKFGVSVVVFTCSFRCDSFENDYIKNVYMNITWSTKICRDEMKLIKFLCTLKWKGAALQTKIAFSFSYIMSSVIM